MRYKSFSTTVAQDTVLKALGITGIETSDAANAFFQEIGIDVTPVRKGRSSIPSVRILDNAIGSFNQYGEGEVSNLYITPVNLHLLAEWVINPERLPKVPTVEAPAINGAAIQAAHVKAQHDEIDRRYADKKRRETQRQALFVQNRLLKQYGYEWSLMQGRTDDDAEEWVLFTPKPNQHVITVEEALQSIREKASQIS